MRITLSSSPCTALPFAHQSLLISFLHRCLGSNPLHDGLSLYSFSALQCGKASPHGINFPNGARCWMSFYEERWASQFVKGVMMNPEFIGGMQITDVQIQETPPFLAQHSFTTASPVLVKSFDGIRTHFLTFSNPEAAAVMTATMQTKLRAAGLDAFANTVRVRFDTSYANAKTKLIDIHGIKNRASVCPVIVEGSPEAVAFAWNVGVGHSTGAGFGALR